MYQVIKTNAGKNSVGLFWIVKNFKKLNAAIKYSFVRNGMITSQVFGFQYKVINTETNQIIYDEE